MSVIAWDGHTLAADCQGTCAGMRNRTHKIKSLPNGDLLAWTGEQDKGLVLFKWYESGCDPKTWPDFQKGENWTRLIIIHGGKAFTLEQYPELIPVLDAFMAWGAGADFAMGAMAMGADAAKAVKIASRFSVHCGMGIRAFKVK